MTPPVEVDPFELPDWLGQEQVLWQATDERGGRETTGTIHGMLRPLHGDEELSLDLLGVDVAWPKPVCDEESRHLAHEAWHYGQVILLDVEGRVTLGVPCTTFSTDLVCEAVRRFSKAVGAEPSRFLVQLRL
ncbi:MAG: hypothetical protein ACRDO0_02770 [Nocardioidaceae bacterium]